MGCKGPDADVGSNIRSLQSELEFLRQENSRLTQALQESRDSTASADGVREADTIAALDTPHQQAFPFPEVDMPWSADEARLTAPPPTLQLKDVRGDWLFLFRNAAPYIASFRGGTVVVHIPSFMLDPAWKASFKGLMEDIAFCTVLGLKVVLVTSVERQLLRQLRATSTAQESSQNFGRGQIVGNAMRGVVIDEQALRIVKQEAGYARVEVERALSVGFEKRNPLADGAGEQPISAGIFSVRGEFSVVSSLSFFTAAPIGVSEGVDYGQAGVVRSVNTDMIDRHLREGDIVSLAPVGASPVGELYYVSSEALAARVAQQLGALKLVYITDGAGIMDTHGTIIPGLQVHHAQALVENLLANARGLYSDVQEAAWFQNTIRHLQHLVRVVSPRGVQRGHLVGPAPGALLQEFYTTDGCGTVVAQDLYQGLGRASGSDVDPILELLRSAPMLQGGRPGASMEEDVKAGCLNGEFFVWRRDEVVLGCGQLVGYSMAGTMVAELRYFASTEGAATQALALFGYAERAAADGGAAMLMMHAPPGSEPATWFAERGCCFFDPDAGMANVGGVDCSPMLAQLGCGAGDLMIKRLGEAAVEEARDLMFQYSEQERRWGNVKG